MKETVMNNRMLNRRDFVRRSLGTAAAAVAADTLISPSVSLGGQAAATPHALRLGGPAFADTEDPEALALAHRKLGYRAAYCPNVALKDTDRIRAIAAAFARQDVVIAEVGRWCNLLGGGPRETPPESPDRDRRAGPGGGHRRPVLRGHCRLVQHNLLVRPAPGQPLPAVLRRRSGERPQDHRRREAEAGQVLLRDDGLGLARQPGQLA